MYSHILIPTDGSELSLHAARQAVELAKLCKAKVTAIMVSPSFHQFNQEGFVMPMVQNMRKRWDDQMSARAQQAFGEIAAAADKAGVAFATVHVTGDAPHEAIIDAANKNGCDMIAMGSHGYGGLKQFFIGSETTRVLSHTKIPVVVYR